MLARDSLSSRGAAARGWGVIAHMPLYEYHCGTCDHSFETLVHYIGDPACCPRCGNSEVAKLLSVPAAAQSSSSRASRLNGDAGQAGLTPFGCGRPQCNQGRCAALD
jgi:putative FmdB family regulatory protein